MKNKDSRQNNITLKAPFLHGKHGECSAEERRHYSRQDFSHTKFNKNLWIFKSVQRPLPDPDNYYGGQTYIVLNRQSSIFRFNRNKSLGVFSPESPIRNFCISLFIHPMFSRFMMLTVIVNCGFMTLSKPPAFVENVLEHVFMTIYTLECIVKVCYHDRIQL